MASKVMMPLAEFDALIEPDELRYELDDVELITMTRPRAYHNEIAGKLLQFAKELSQVASNRKVFTAEQLDQLGPNTKRAPDVSVVLKPRIIGRNEELNGAPDVAIEVISPSESNPAIHRKLGQYFRAGCRVALVAYPETNEVEIWLPPGIPTQTLSLEDALALPDLLPEWSIPVREIINDD